MHLMQIQIRRVSVSYTKMKSVFRKCTLIFYSSPTSRDWRLPATLNSQEPGAKIQFYDEKNMKHIISSCFSGSHLNEQTVGGIGDKF